MVLCAPYSIYTYASGKNNYIKIMIDYTYICSYACMHVHTYILIITINLYKLYSLWECINIHA